MKFWVPWGIDAAIASIAVYFFFVGLADGSVSSFNFGLWAGLLAILAAIVGGSLWLKGKGRLGSAVALLWLLAAPGVLAALLVVAVLLTNPRWN